MKGKKLLGTLTALALLASPAMAKTLVYNLGVEPKTIDPVLNSAVDGGNVIANSFEGLVRRTEKGIEPGLAESWQISDDGLTVTFKIRDNAKWSDGKPITAGDFVFSFRRMLTPENAAPYSYLGYFIKNGQEVFEGKAKPEELGVEAKDDHTFVLHCNYAAPLLLEYLTFSPFVATREDVVSADNRGWTTKGTLVCSGPFYVDSWKHNDKLILKKNPYYWDADNVKLDQVDMVMINDANTALAAYKAGKVDVNKTIPGAQIPLLLKSGEAKVLDTLGTGYTVFNTKVKPFDDLRVRKAFSLALDRQTIVDKVTMSGQKPANGFIPYGIPGVVDGKGDFRSEDTAKYDDPHAQVEEAKKLLAEAGYPDGKGLPEIVYSYNTNEGNKRMAEALQAMWKQNLGVDVKLQNEEWKVFIDRRNQKNFMLARAAWLSDFMDAENMLALFETKNWENCTNWSNAKYDELINGAAKEGDRAKRIGMMHDAEKILMEELPMISMYFYATPYMQKDYVSGVYYDPFNHDHLAYADVNK